jgi:protocatechuate 3,4-dioxygenase beta subunit
MVTDSDGDFSLPTLEPGYYASRAGRINLDQ